jgi:hypothetical protein
MEMTFRKRLRFFRRLALGLTLAPAGRSPRFVLA